MKNKLSSRPKKIVKKIVLTSLALAVIGAGSLFYYLNPSNRKASMERHPFSYNKQLYCIDNGIIEIKRGDKTNDERINIPAKNITDFVIKDSNFYFIEHTKDRESRLKEFIPGLEKVVELSEPNDYAISLDLQDGELLKKIAENEGESVNYYLGNRIVSGLAGENPQFVNGKVGKVYSIKNKNIVVQEIKYSDSNKIELNSEKKLTSSKDYLEIRVLGKHIYSLRGPDYTSCDLYDSINGRLTYDRLYPLGFGKMKQDLIVYKDKEDNKIFASFMQGTRSQVGKVIRIDLGGIKNEK